MPEAAAVFITVSWSMLPLAAIIWLRNASYLPCLREAMATREAKTETGPRIGNSL